MLELKDFSSILQIIIAYYSVYVAVGDDILKSFIFGKVHKELETILDAIDNQYKKISDFNENFEADVCDMDLNKLSDSENSVLQSWREGIKHDMNYTKSLKNLIKSMFYEYRGETFFSVFSTDIIFLCSVFMVLGVLDCKVICNIDAIASIMLLVVILLSIHCFTYEFSSKARNVERYKPNVTFHFIVLAVSLVMSLIAYELYKFPYAICNDINTIMSVWGIVVVLPSLLEIAYNMKTIRKMKSAIKDKGKAQDILIGFYERSLASYKKKCSKGE